ncbi:MAG: transketolase [Burkholderia sp.]|nr:transketolase [Burkholderia sp.]
MTISLHSSSALMANAIRVLTMDAVQQANSGHPGMPMGMAEIGVALWSRHFKHNPVNPLWVDRDRFILSNGHGSMLLYALLHLTGYDLPIDELKNFRQLHSKTPGHPEYGITPGVEATTGPLGQGLANAVGMALGESLMAAEFNREDARIVDHYTYVFLGDGCLMEGISHEACSLAGTLKLNKLIALYDDNGISIDGKVVHWFNDDSQKRFEAYGWNVIPNVNGHDVDSIDVSISQAKQSDKPTIIFCKTLIGQGAATKAGNYNIHGAALGKEEISKTRKALGWSWEPFVIPQEVYKAWDAKKIGMSIESDWNMIFSFYRKKYSIESAEFERRMMNSLPEKWPQKAKLIISIANERRETIATRKASQQTIEDLASILPEFLGGSADLTASNLTDWKLSKSVRANKSDTGILYGNYINYGVREFGMSAIINGLVLHGGYRPFGGTFLTFSDYSRSAIRSAALMKIPSIFVFTHDSIGLGEDGPTHQSIEHISCLRMIPNHDVWRPADTVETAVAWTHAISSNYPSSLIFSRQKLIFNVRTEEQISNIEKGGYVLKDWNNEIIDHKIILLATGSEVDLAIKAIEPLAQHGITARVVSMPSTTVFDRQNVSYRDNVLPHGVRRIAIEAGITSFWRKYVGLEGGVIGIDTFGESAPKDVLFKYFGFTINNIIEIAKSILI